MPDAAGARLKRVRLTPQGRELMTRASAIARAVDIELFAADSRKTLRDELQAVVARAGSS